MLLAHFLGTLVLLSSLIAASQAATDAELTEKYRFSKVLDDNNNIHNDMQLSKDAFLTGQKFEHN